jgi:hypothetical protein
MTNASPGPSHAGNQVSGGPAGDPPLALGESTPGCPTVGTRGGACVAGLRWVALTAALELCRGDDVAATELPVTESAAPAWLGAVESVALVGRRAFETEVFVRRGSAVPVPVPVPAVFVVLCAGAPLDGAAVFEVATGRGGL